ncbi:MAG TPA: DUF5719 family protein [Actinomycetota bacterium]|nr:DUF5719 family protein [Actinomycetota bacterium]
MNDRRGEVMFAGIVVILFLVGVAFDVGSTEVRPGSGTSIDSSTFRARSTFCPGAISAPAADLDVVVAAPFDDPVTVRIEPHEDAPVEVPSSGGVLYDVGNGEPTDVVGYGGVVSAHVLTTTERPGAGAGAGACAGAADDTWYFAAGSASLHVDERILLYNPFPDEAVVRIVLFTPKGEMSKASLADIPVPSRTFTVVELNKAVQVEEGRRLALQVRAERGRVVAWRQMFVADEDRPTGMQLSLGAPQPAVAWHFPEGAVGGGAVERISILNPSEEEAVVAITLAVDRAKVLSPPDLMEVAVPPRSQTNVRVGDHVKTGDEPVAVSATVRSINEVRVVAEREVSYDSDAGVGVAAELGATVESERWIAPPAAATAAEDALSILNPSTDEARVSLRLLGLDGIERATPGLVDPEIGPGGRVRIPLARWTGGDVVLAFVESNVPVVVERFAFERASRDVASLMGVPLP